MKPAICPTCRRVIVWSRNTIDFKWRPYSRDPEGGWKQDALGNMRLVRPGESAPVAYAVHRCTTALVGEP